MKYTPPYGSSDPNAAYVNGNPAAGVRGSIIPAGAVEEPQREVLAAIAAAGLTPSDNDLKQLLRAIRSGRLLFYPDNGSVNQLAVAPDPAHTSYVQGLEFHVLVGATTTGAATLNVNNLGPKPITHKDGSALSAGDLTQGQIAVVLFDGTNFQLQATAGSSQFVIPYVADNGSANTIVANYAPAITSLTAGLVLQVKIFAANTSAVTMNVNNLGAKPVKNGDGSALTAGALSPGEIVIVTYDGNNFQIGSVLAGAGISIPYVADSSGTANSVVANFVPAVSSYAAGLVVLVKIANSNTGPSTINANSLGAKSIIRQGGGTLRAGDLPAGVVAVLIYDGTNFQLQGLIASKDTGRLLRVTPITASGTFAWHANANNAMVYATGAGGAGGGDPNNLDGVSGNGGAAGGTAIVYLSNVSVLGPVTCTVGAGGTGAVGVDGGDGSATSFGSLAAASGGKGGKYSGTAANSPGASPGIGTIGDLLLSGQAGDPSNGNQGGSGGSSYWGGGGFGQQNTSSPATPGGAGGNYGGGGGGGDRIDGGAGGAGGAGGPGIIWVWEFT